MKLRHLLPICLSAALPGWGHIAAGKPAKGLLLFFLFGFAVDGWLYSHAQGILPADSGTAALATVRQAAIGLGVLLWAFAVADTAALALRRRRIEAQASLATAHVREALIAYLRDDYDAALKSLRCALRVNGEDPDALFQLGAVYARMGRTRKARRAFRRCLRHDADGKWDYEANQHLDALEAPPPAPAPARPAAREEGES